MRGQVSQVFSRQTTDEAWSRGSRCTCRARRYIPPRKQVNNSLDGSSSSRRKQSTSRDYAPPDQDDLLRELNGGSVGWLRDEEEQDWGLDDVAEHARARHQQQLQRFGGVPSVANGAPTSGANGRDGRSGGSGGGGGGGAGGTGRRRDGRRRRIESSIHETFGSPLESGLASISTAEGKENKKEMFSTNNNRDRVTCETQDVKSTGAAAAAVAAAASSGGQARGALAGMSPGAASVSTTTTIPESSKKPRKGRTTVEMELSYARRNPEVVEALRLRGFAVRVRQSDGVTSEEMDHGVGDEGAADGGQYPGLDRDHLDSDSDIDGFGLNEEDDGLDLDLDLDLDLTVAQDLGDQAHGSIQGRKTGRSRDARNGQTVQSGSRVDWYDSLAAAGFSVRSNAAGEVFLERTVRRKNLAAATTTATTSTFSGVKAPTTAAAGAKAAAESPPPPTPILSVPPLEPLSGRPAIVKALQRLTTPQQVLDFLELSYSQWAANGYRLADMQSGKPVAGPSPAEAAHCLRALATTARRTGTGGWRCLELAAGRQAQGLAEALRVTPPRLLPEQATQQLAAAYFDVARRFWLDPAAESIIDDPRVRRARSPAAATAAANPGVATTGDAGAAPLTLTDERNNVPLGVAAGNSQSPLSQQSIAAASSSSSPSSSSSSPSSNAIASPVSLADDDFPAVMAPLSSSSPYDPLYDSLVAKYTAMSQDEKLRERAGDGSSRQQQQQQQEENNQVINGHAVPAIAARTEDEKLVLAAESPSTVPPAADAAHRGAAADAAVAAKRRAAKVECLVSALWAMSSLGGSPYFQAETEAVVTILIRCLASAAVSAAGAAARQTATAAPAAAPPAAGGVGVVGGLTGWQAGQVLWALGNSRHVTPRLPELEASLLRSGGLSYMQPRDVTRVLWGFASLGYKPERLLLTIRPDWSWRERTASERESVRSRKAKARGKGMKGNGNGSGSGGASSGSGLEVGEGDVRSFSPQQLACAVWALAVMEKVNTGPFRAAWVQLLRRSSDVPPSEPVMTQIWQANLAINLESSSTSPTSQSSAPSAPPTPIDGGRVTGTVPTATSASRPGGSRAATAAATAAEDLTTAGLAAAAGGGDVDVAAARSLLLRSRDVFLAATSALRRKVQSGYQRQMANTLTGLRMMHLLEDNSAGYSIDITLPQLRIALEADGPTHISRTPCAAVLGATAMKRRHLQRMGWHVVNVTYKEWDKLTSESARRAFLQERINEALLSRIQIGDEDGESNDD